MDVTAQQRTASYVSARYQNPAWQLLASHRAPLVLGCLQTLFEQAHDGIPMEDALQALAEMLAEYANQDDYEIDLENAPVQARRELRNWIKRTLVVEREGRLYATDALETALRFVEGLDNRIMTTTASRLSVVQREIENLETGLNPSPASRVASLRRRIDELERELADAEAGKVPVLSEAEAIEGIREVYNLATGLRADFRRVEDSWRDADRELRQSIISEQYHRGQIVDRLLDGHDALLDTPEGRVFESFQLQLRQSVDLERMKERLRSILRHPAVSKALSRNQERDLRWLVMRLVKESQSVFQARARSERDVKGFLKTGLAAEHHRVGNLLNEIFNAALKLDWQRQVVRRQTTPLPPVAIAVSGLPLIERLRFKSLENDVSGELDLATRGGDLEQIDEDFWAAFDGLDRDALVRDTLATLAREGRVVSIAELAHLLPPTHDLETFTLWLGMAREAGIPVANDCFEEVELTDEESHRWLFRLPYAGLESNALANIDWEH
jgi:polyhydroxyalkanoate synthesis regulator phasin